MEFITANTQKKVVINRATFRDASNLKKEVMKCLLNLKGIDIFTLNAQDKTKLLDVVIELLISADTSEGLENALFACLKTCLYDNFYAITPEFFDDKPEAIEDYYEIAAKCIEVNLRPFGKSLVTEYKARLAKLPQENQLSE